MIHKNLFWGSSSCEGNGCARAALLQERLVLYLECSKATLSPQMKKLFNESHFLYDEQGEPKQERTAGKTEEGLRKMKSIMLALNRNGPRRKEQI